MKTDKKYTIQEVSKLDKEIRNLSNMFSAARLKIGLETASRLLLIEDNKLYLKLDEKAYPNFSRYIESVGMNYKTARQLMSILQTFVMIAGTPIEELAKISYPKLSVLKPYLFHKENGKYVLSKSLAEYKKWLNDAASDLSIEDLKQSRREKEVGDHPHEWEHFKSKRCRVCKLREGDY